MAEDSTDFQGERMLVLTDVLKQPKVVINTRILPRTMEVDKVAVIIIGAAFGLLVGILISPNKLVGALYGAVAGAVVLFLLYHITPFAGESLFSWGKTMLKYRENAVYDQTGRKRNLHIGLAPVRWNHQGVVKIRAAAMPLITGTVDHRGYPIIDSREAIRAQDLMSETGFDYTDADFPEAFTDQTDLEQQLAKKVRGRAGKRQPKVSRQMVLSELEEKQRKARKMPRKMRKQQTSEKLSAIPEGAQWEQLREAVTEGTDWDDYETV